MPTLSPTDLGTLLLCSVRYALGRQTYMPVEVCRIIREHLADLTDQDVRMLAQEIRREDAWFPEDIADLWVQMLTALEEETARRLPKPTETLR